MRNAPVFLFALFLLACFSYALIQSAEREARVRAAALDALDFLAEKQSFDGSWRDFYMPPLDSTADEWVTAYVALAVSEAKEKGFSTPASEEALQKAIDFLKTAKRADGGWAYGVAWNQSDADSTAFAVRVLHREAPGVDLSDSIALLKRHEKNGGYSTYLAPPYFLKECGAWCEPVPDVSANVVMALKETGSEFNESAAVAYLLSQQGPEGFWQAYWWPNKYYGTTFAVEALKELGYGSQRLQKTAAWLESSKNADGGWGENGSDAFSTALASRALSRGVDWLVANNSLDGSWASSAVLRVPDPAWPPSSGRGFSVREENALFSVASLVCALVSA
ncbi:hypothetical protein H0O03_03750 [Candidatus Micrarchaeota archaeon]|nr:hypothetical protein [Candidatus Micrarchaeota archaeon]